MNSDLQLYMAFRGGTRGYPQVMAGIPRHRREDAQPREGRRREDAQPQEGRGARAGPERAIIGGHPEAGEPYVQPRDTRKCSEEERKEMGSD